MTAHPLFTPADEDTQPLLVVGRHRKPVDRSPWLTALIVALVLIAVAATAMVTLPVFDSAADPESQPVLVPITVTRPTVDPRATLVTFTTPEPTDDTPGFDCRRNGNGVCGPDNPQGYPAGCYVRTGKRAGTLLTPWDERMRQELFTGTYRPTRCGRPTLHDRQMTRRADGTVGQLCADNAHGGVTCWFADQPRPHDADGAPWDPDAGRV